MSKLALFVFTALFKKKRRAEMSQRRRKRKLTIQWPRSNRLAMENVIGLLRIRVQRGINLVARDRSSSDPYVIVTMASQRLKTLRVKRSCNPEWNDELTLAILGTEIPILLSVYDRDTFTKDDAMGDAIVDIEAIFECRKMELSGVESGTVLTTVEPNWRNCLAEKSEVVCKDGKVVQDMKLRLRNAQTGQVVIQLEWIHVS